MRYITPESLMQGRFGSHELPQYDAAVILFRDQTTSEITRRLLNAEVNRGRILYGMSSDCTYTLTVKDKKVLLIEQCLWGGPQTAIILEELAFLKIRLVIGLGACGSLTKGIPRGTLVYNSTAVLNDGTSKFYSGQQSIKTRMHLLDKLAGFFQENNFIPAVSGTIDALYQETDQYIDRLAKDGIQIINMESGPFYAVSEYCNLDAVWLGGVSDCLYDQTWIDWSAEWPKVVESLEKSGLLLMQALSFLL
jgi:uridine phosphorylase